MYSIEDIQRMREYVTCLRAEPVIDSDDGADLEPSQVVECLEEGVVPVTRLVIGAGATLSLTRVSPTAPVSALSTPNEGLHVVDGVVGGPPVHYLWTRLATGQRLAGTRPVPPGEPWPCGLASISAEPRATLSLVGVRSAAASDFAATGLHIDLASHAHLIMCHMPHQRLALRLEAQADVRATSPTDRRVASLDLEVHAGARCHNLCVIDQLRVMARGEASLVDVDLHVLSSTVVELSSCCNKTSPAPCVGMACRRPRVGCSGAKVSRPRPPGERTTPRARSAAVVVDVDETTEEEVNQLIAIVHNKIDDIKELVRKRDNNFHLYDADEDAALMAVEARPPVHIVDPRHLRRYRTAYKAWKQQAGVLAELRAEVVQAKRSKGRALLTNPELFAERYRAAYAESRGLTDDSRKRQATVSSVLELRDHEALAAAGPPVTDFHWPRCLSCDDKHADISYGCGHMQWCHYCFQRASENADELLCSECRRPVKTATLLVLPCDN